MAAELVSLATSEALAEMDWMQNIEICELVAKDQRQAKDVIKAIKKRLGSKNPSTQLYAVMLLEMLMNNIGESIHKHVIDTGVLPILTKIVKKKSDLPVREKIFLLLDATQTSLGGASGKFPEYYKAYYDLVKTGVQFPRRQNPRNNLPSEANNRNTLNEQLASARQEGVAPQKKTGSFPELSIIQKAGNALEVLKEVLDAVDPSNPEGARDEFTLDLVEQCSFQKERVMHLAITSRDEKVVSQAIELNEQLQRILTRHDDLLSGRISVQDKPISNGYHLNNGSRRAAPNSNHHNYEPSVSKPNGYRSNNESSSSLFSVSHLNSEEEDEEEEPEQLFRRMRKGKACARPEDDMHNEERQLAGFLGSGVTGERLNRPLIRPLSSETSPDMNIKLPQVVIPPPPAKHQERERFFREKRADGSAIDGHMRGLSLHSRNTSSSRSGSMDLSD